MNYKRFALLALLAGNTGPFAVVMITILTSQGDWAFAGSVASQAQLSLLLGGNEIYEDFEGLAVTEGGQNQLGSPLSSVSSTYGPGLVESGATYSQGGANPLYWNGNGYYLLNSRTLGDSNINNGAGLSVTYTVPINAMGFDLQGYSGYSQMGTVSVYDTNNVLLTASPVNGGFFGWENSAGISRVVVLATSTLGYIMIDNHGYGQMVPEPASIGLAAVGNLGLLLALRRRRK